ncbi:MAG: hypothetical protein ACOXZS_00585 [Bacilli bacterium]|jgi:hypothetical protein
MNIDFNFKVDEDILARFILYSALYDKRAYQTIVSVVTSEQGKLALLNIFNKNIDLLNSKKIDEIRDVIRNLSINNIDQITKEWGNALGYMIPIDVTYDDETKEFFKLIKMTPFYNEMFEKSKQNMERIKQNWQAKKELINEFLRSVLGKDINDIVDAYILAPDMHFGEAFKSWLVWGHDAGLNEPNFDLTYIIHEYLHILFNRHNNSEYDKNPKVVHTVIELIADDLLYSKLTGDPGKQLPGHAELEPYKEKIYPLFFEYLGKPNRNIDTFIENIMNNDEILAVGISEMAR